jgi:hypothetical protein
MHIKVILKKFVIFRRISFFQSKRQLFFHYEVSNIFKIYLRKIQRNT